MQSQMPDTDENRRALARFVAQEILKDGRIPPFSPEAVHEVIAEAARRSEREGHLTTRLRDLGGLVRVAGDLAAHGGEGEVRAEHVQHARSYALTIEQQLTP
jgi:Lon-like ATP-dependent protease